MSIFLSNKRPYANPALTIKKQTNEMPEAKKVVATEVVKEEPNIETPKEKAKKTSKKKKGFFRK